MADEKEKYEAVAHFKIKGQDREERRQNLKAAIEIAKTLNEFLFHKGLTDVYEEGMKCDAPYPDFMIQLTEFFITCTTTFYMVKRPEEEIIKDVELFLDSVKEDVKQTVRQVFDMRKRLKPPT